MLAGLKKRLLRMQLFFKKDSKLYNLKEDIGKENNLRNKNPQKYRKLQGILDDWHQENKMPIPSKPNERSNQAHFKTTYKRMRVNSM